MTKLCFSTAEGQCNLKKTEKKTTYPGLSLIFEVGGDVYKKIAGIRVAVVKSTCWLYIKVAGDVPQNTRGKSPACGS